MSISKTIGVSEVWKEGYERLAKAMAMLLPDGPGASILELGSGRGQLTIPLLSRVSGRIVAVDRSEEDLKGLSMGLAALGLEGRVEPLLCDAMDLKVDDGSMDAVCSNFFFGWIAPAEAMDLLNELYRVLKPGGVMVHSDLCPAAENRAQEIALDQGRPENNLDPSPKWWTPEELGRLVEDAGFSHTEVSYFDWEVRFGYDEALRQLRRWGARDAFIGSVDRDLKEHGMELPKSFILKAVKV
ncbi:MAG: class I SAM-dependent methyltransferase [Methanobacteriota archaeon]|nr:MAG: class I SAM-dependent methyltransferase [Euryarchaeota archaeon]